MDYILDLINYKVLKCSSLFINIDNFRHNKAVMICSTSIFISILLLIIFFCSRIEKIRIKIYREIPSYQKLKQYIIKERKKNNSIRLINTLAKDTFIHNSNIMSSNDKIINLKKNRKNKYEKKNSKYDIFSSRERKIYKDKNINNKNIKEVNIQNIINKELNNNNINNKKLVEYDNLPFKMALKMDNRFAFYIFLSKVTEKIKIIDIFKNKQLKEIALSEYFLYLLIDLTTNAMLYSDNIVSHKRHNNGKLDTIIVILLSGFANVLASMIEYYLELLVCFEDKIEQIKEIRRENIFLRVFKIILREIKIRVILFFVCEIVLIFCCTYYLFIFFTIYHKSQISLLKSYLISLLETWLINLLIAIFIVIFRKLGIYFRNKYIYNTSKYLDKNF